MAQKIVCPNCKKVINSTENTCPNCGIAITDEMRRKNKVSLSGCLFVIFAIIIGCYFLFGGEKENKEITMPGTPLAYKQVKMELNKHAAPGRDQLTATLVLGSEQENATQKELISTAMQAALDYDKMVGSPITIINILAQNTGNAWADRQLAFIVYIPDKKGYDGTQETGIWDKAMACERGFSADELTYLQLWGKLRTKYLDPGTDSLPVDKEEALDAEIVKTMGKELDFDPMLNIMWAAKGIE